MIGHTDSDDAERTAHAPFPRRGRRRRGRSPRGVAPFVVVTDILPGGQEGTDAIIGGTGQPDDPVTSALLTATLRRGGTWIGRPPASAPRSWPAVPRRGLPVDDADAAGYDAGHNRRSIWPLYHDLAQPARYERGWRQAYRRINHQFALAVADAAAPAASVWIHDYKLQLVPGYLRRFRPDLRIGLTLPIHFPAPDLFHHLPLHQELLRGLAGADLIGFPSAVAAENFLRLREEVTDQSTAVGVFPASVDSPAIAALADHAETARQVRRLRSALGQPATVILCMNVLEDNQGIERRLRSLEPLLRQRRSPSDDVTVIQITTGCAGGDPSVGDRIAREVARLNGQYSAVGRPRVHYLRADPDLQERVTLYRLADLMIATPLREGTSGSALEYVAARRTDGALILSELSGTAAVLPDAYVINPFDDDAFQAAATAALTATRDERARRMAAMHGYVGDYDNHAWARNFLIGLEANQPRRSIVDIRDGADQTWPAQPARSAAHDPQWWLSAAT